MGRVKDANLEKIQLSEVDLSDMEPDWEGECETCGSSPIVPLTGLCGPCTFGEADTVGGNW